MEPSKPTTLRRGCLVLGFVFSPLTLAFLWCAFVDQEGFGAFVLGVLFTLLFGAVAIVTFLVKKLLQRKTVETPDD